MPCVEIDFSEDTSTAAALVRCTVHAETDSPREPESIRKTLCYALKLCSVYNRI